MNLKLKKHFKLVWFVFLFIFCRYMQLLPDVWLIPFSRFIVEHSVSCISSTMRTKYRYCVAAKPVWCWIPVWFLCRWFLVPWGYKTVFILTLMSWSRYFTVFHCISLYTNTQDNFVLLCWIKKLAGLVVTKNKIYNVFGMPTEWHNKINKI